MIWVYGICDRPDLPAPRRRGIAQAPLDGLREGSLFAVFTRHVRSVSEPAPDALWVHERVVERLMADRTVLPMRFGSKVDDERALREFLVGRGQSLAAALERIGGRVELGVRVLEPLAAGDGAAVAATVAAPPTGRDYLLAKLRDGQRAARASASLHEPLEALASQARRQPPRVAGEILRSSYLVDRRVVPRFRAAVERLQTARPDVAILCTGPWPPYSFVGDVREASAGPRPALR
jgi:hypothetical protein